MALSNYQRSQLCEATRDAARALVEDLEHIRDVIGRLDQSRGELRRMSAILRRLLVEGSLGEIAAPRIGRIRISAPDNNPVYKLIDGSAPVELFISGGTQIFGLLLRAYMANTEHSALALPEFDPDRTVLLRIDSFLTQPVLFWKGKWGRRLDVIKYIANVASGVHATTPKDDVEKYLHDLRSEVVMGLREPTTPGEPDGIGIAIKPPDKPFDEAALKFKGGAVDLLMLEMFAAARYLVESADVRTLEETIKTSG
jgi:hypothetical protein